jgi:uncharacterized protein GlcG (DUF336 family)
VSAEPQAIPGIRVIDEAKMQAFVEKAVGEFGATLSTALVAMGDRLGFFKAMAHAGPMKPQDLARKTRTSERLVREWLVNQAASGNVEYDPAAGTFTLPVEHALALADDASPYFVAGGYQVVTAMVKAEGRVADSFQNEGCSGASTTRVSSRERSASFAPTTSRT